MEMRGMLIFAAICFHMLQNRQVALNVQEKLGPRDLQNTEDPDIKMPSCCKSALCRVGL